MLDRLRLAVGPVGETCTVREIVPANPLMLVTLIVDMPEDPASMVKLPGLAEIVKSEDVLTVNWTSTLWVRPLFVPVTLIVPEGLTEPASTVRVDVLVTFEDTVTEEGKMDHVVQPGHIGENV